MGICTSKSVLTYETAARMQSRPEQQSRMYGTKFARIVDSVAELELSLLKSPLQFFIIDRLEEWFEEDPEDKEIKKPTIALANLANIKIDFLERKPKTKHKNFEFSQLASPEDLMLLLKNFQKQFTVSETLMNIVNDFAQLRDRTKFYIGNTIRKEQQCPTYQLDSSISSVHILQKILCHVYSTFLKKQLASDNTELNSFISQFHQKIGLVMFSFIRCSKLSSDNLLQVIYALMMIRVSHKKGEEHQQLVIDRLTEIKNKFQKIFIQEEYTYDLEPRELNDIKSVTSSYVHDLYRKTLAEIDNPAIAETEAPLRALFIFPVQTVKSRNKKY